MGKYIAFFLEKYHPNQRFKKRARFTYPFTYYALLSGIFLTIAPLWLSSAKEDKSSLYIGRKSLTPVSYQLYLASFAYANQIQPYHSLAVTPHSENEGALQQTSLIATHNALPQLNDYPTREQPYEILEYTVQPGDVLSRIANDFKVSQTSILWANNISNSDYLKPGQVLKIPPDSGVIHTVRAGDTVSSIARTYSGNISEILSYNGLSTQGNLKIGQELIVPNGKPPTISKPSRGSTPSSRFAHLPNRDSYFILPTSGRYNLKRGIHNRNGVDINNACGSEVVAAATGTIVGAKSNGWNGGAGKYIKINHPNGTDTFYAHLSAVLMSTGALVEQGQIIGKIGTTGNSTGCHLHFEVHGAKNPAAN